MRKNIERNIIENVVQSKTLLADFSLRENEAFKMYGNITKKEAEKKAIKLYGNGTKISEISTETVRYLISVEDFVKNATKINE